MAIGDGANDVSMIQTADVGVGKKLRILNYLILKVGINFGTVCLINRNKLFFILYA